MSLAVVNKQIDAIYKKGIAEESDIAALITAAERSQKGKSDGVSNAEARAVADFFVRLRAGLSSRSAPAVKVSERGLEMLNSFFVAHHLPYGVNAKPMMELVAGVLKNMVYGGATQEPASTKLEDKPRTGSLQPLRIDPERIAYVDAVKKQFVVKQVDGFYGPFELPTDKKPEVV
jgi:hypothetical protein